MQNETITSNYVGKIICELLGYSKNDYVSKQMSYLKDYVEHQKYYDISSILQDGTIGIIVASKLAQEYEENQDKNMLIQIYNLFLSQVANLVASKQYEAAINQYSEMILVLANHFGMIDLAEERTKQYGKILMVA